jgi:hypothetical protein
MSSPLAEGIALSVTAETMKGYIGKWKWFQEQVGTHEPNSDEERKAFEQLAHNYVRGEGGAGSTMDSLRCAILKHHQLMGIAHSWANDPLSLQFIKGLKSQAGQDSMLRGVLPRIQIPQPLFRDLLELALEKRRYELALGLHCLFFGLFRHHHLRIMLRADLLFTSDARYVLIYIWGAKASMDKIEGHYVKVVGARQAFVELLASRRLSWADLIFTRWSESDAVAYVKAFCESAGIRGFTIDVHALRASGARFYEEQGIDPREIRVQGGWSPSSESFEESYRALPPPEAIRSTPTGHKPADISIQDSGLQRPLSEAHARGLALRQAAVAERLPAGITLAPSNIPPTSDSAPPGDALLSLAERVSFPSKNSCKPDLISHEVWETSELLFALKPLRCSKAVGCILLEWVYTTEEAVNGRVNSEYEGESYVGRVEYDRLGDKNEPVKVTYTHRIDDAGEVIRLQDSDGDHATLSSTLPKRGVGVISLLKCKDPESTRQLHKDLGRGTRINAADLEGEPLRREARPKAGLLPTRPDSNFLAMADKLIAESTPAEGFLAKSRRLVLDSAPAHLRKKEIGPWRRESHNGF